MKQLITKTALLILMLSMAAKAQDIIVKKDNGRIVTHVVKITDSIVKCKGFEKNSDTTFAIKTQKIKMIIYEIGNVQNFDENKNAKIDDGYAIGSNKTDVVSAEVKNENNIRHYGGSFEVGSGFTAAAILGKTLLDNYAQASAYQVNARGMVCVGSKNNFLFGLNANYTNACLLTGDSRKSIHLILQIALIKEGKNMMYFNSMGGLSVFDNAGWGGKNDSMILPGAHVGLGYKYFASNNTGFFIETGIGGPYFINAGIFFY